MPTGGIILNYLDLKDLVGHPAPCSSKRFKKRRKKGGR